MRAGLHISESLAAMLAQRAVFRIEVDVSSDIAGGSDVAMGKGAERARSLIDLDAMEFLAARAPSMKILERKQWTLAIKAMEHDARAGPAGFAEAWKRPWRRGSRVEKAMERIGSSMERAFKDAGFGRLSSGLAQSYSGTKGLLCARLMLHAGRTASAQASTKEQSQPKARGAMRALFGGFGRLGVDEACEPYPSWASDGFGRGEFASGWTARQLRSSMLAEVPQALGKSASRPRI